MIITAESLIKAGLAAPATATQVVNGLNATCNKFNINTNKRVAGFLAQCAHESCKFTITQENLNYGPNRLFQVFPKYFTAQTAAEYGGHPQKIANKIYGGRMGNGPEATGDGWRFHGRGFIQLTGKNNYVAFGQAVGIDFTANPDLVATPQYAALSAGWFWSTNGLNEIADAGDIVAMTKRINGGTIGLIERTALYYKALGVFK
jgi:putative chitinase